MFKFVVLSALVCFAAAAPAPGFLHGGYGLPAATSYSSRVDLIHSTPIIKSYAAPAIVATPVIASYGGLEHGYGYGLGHDYGSIGHGYGSIGHGYGSIGHGYGSIGYGHGW